MREEYRHTQIGYVTLAALGAIGCITALVVATLGAHPLALAVLGFSFVVLLFFSTLTVTVSSERVSCHFSLGLVGRELRTADIVTATVVRNRWYHGWGIHSAGNGWLWNVSGFQAVELQLRDGASFRIGTDEPEALVRAIQARLPNES